MPSDTPLGSTYDSSIIKSEGGPPITLESEQAHEDALQTELKVSDMIAALKGIQPEKAASLEAALAKYNAGTLKAEVMHTVLKMQVGVPNMMKAYSQLLPTYDKRHCFPAGWQHPILV